MEIKKITKLKNGKYKILLDNKEFITTYDDVVIGENLLYKKEIDLELLQKLASMTSYFDIYHKIVKMIGVKYRSQREIEKILEKENISAQDRESILTRLIQNGFICDKRFMDCYINDRLYLSTDGPFLIRKNLLSYGIEENMVIDALDKIDISLFYDKLLKQVKKKVKNNTKYSKYILRNKIVHMFIEKGFEEKMILLAFDACFVEDDTVLFKEYQKNYQKLSSQYDGEKLSFMIKQKLYRKGFSKEEIERVLSQNR